MAYIWFALICIVWGSSFILMKKSVVCFSPVAVGWGRVLGGAAILAILWAWRSRRLEIRSRDLPLMALIVVLGFAWPYSIQPHLVARDGSAFVGITVSFTPLLTVLVSIPILGTYPKPRQLAGVLGALVCLGLLMRDGWERAIPAIDLLLALSVPLGYAITNTLIRRYLRHVPPLELTLLALSVTTVILAPLAIHSPGPGGSTDQLVWAVAAIFVLGVFGTGLAMFLFNVLIHGHGPLFAGMVTNLVPVGALLWAWADGEQVTPLQIGALAGLLVMVTLVQYGATSRPPTPLDEDDQALAP
jgi:drug/metabolite transporter (DMT)-like permease